ncbi:MAG: anthranilate synthase component I [Phycisphaeraceae bacterium]|nr:anthranilate synthase component I [Phycisphaerales bacterium]MCB9844317.1 anthranilate synthase component I [Phycisphaeraceae bacterium]
MTSAQPKESGLIECVANARRLHPGATVAVPVGVRLLGDQLTPVLAYRRLVAADDRLAPSFLFESVENGDRQGRYSILGAHPVIEVVAHEHDVTVIDHRATPGSESDTREDDPLLVMRRLTAHIRQVDAPGAKMPDCMLGGWVGFAGYDTVRYAEPEMLSFAGAPPDDRNLPDLHFGFYDRVVVFDHVDKVVHVVVLAIVGQCDDAGEAYRRACAQLDATVVELQVHSKPLASGVVDDEGERGGAASNLTPAQHAAMVERAREYIKAGDIFQVVVGQRFERRSEADPFDVYRALRVVNPSPYMVYLQARGCLLVASSPEILCRVRRDESGALMITNRPLAGTRKRGRDEDEDAALEQELLADQKERAEHIMLVDLGRNDVGHVSRVGSVRLPALMEIERYSHVMHISSTVTGTLREGLDCWDALRATLPVGTISGAPKIRAMQIIDELEPMRRGPYGGGFGYATLGGEMDIALALRTIVVPTALHRGAQWVYHLQASGGIVFDSDAHAEYEETVNKSAAMVRAIDLAERAFVRAQ